MKKILLVLVVLVLTISFSCLVACSSLNQLNMLSMGWLDYEKYTYNVYEINGEENSIIGSMEYIFERVDGKVTVNEKEFDVTKAATVNYKLTVTEGQYKGSTLEALVLFDSNLYPVASYKKYNCSDAKNSYSSFADYSLDGKTGSYVYIDGEGNESSNEFKKTNAYDNDSLYTLIRASVFDVDSYSLSMSVPDKATFTLRTVQVAIMSNEVQVTTDYSENEFTCTKIATVMLSDIDQSPTHYLYYANSPIRVDGKDIVKPLVEIQEDNYHYVLKDISIVK